jgi:hypothetical protein
MGGNPNLKSKKEGDNPRSRVIKRHSAKSSSQEPDSDKFSSILIALKGMGDEVRQGRRKPCGGDWLASAGSSGQFSIIHLTE